MHYCAAFIGCLFSRLWRCAGLLRDRRMVYALDHNQHMWVKVFILRSESIYRIITKSPIATIDSSVHMCACTRCSLAAKVM